MKAVCDPAIVCREAIIRARSRCAHFGVPVKGAMVRAELSPLP